MIEVKSWFKNSKEKGFNWLVIIHRR